MTSDNDKRRGEAELQTLGSNDHSRNPISDNGASAIGDATGRYANSTIDIDVSS